MKAKLATLASLMLVLGLLLAACGDSTASTSGGATTTAASGAATTAANAATTATSSGKTVKLKFWGGVPEESGPTDVVNAWNKANPDIQVEYVRYVNDDAGNTKLDTALLSQKDAPDIFMSYTAAGLTKRVNAGITVPLDDFIAKQGFDVEGILGSENINRYDNKIHYLPASKSIDGILFNKSALDEVGAKVPVAGWTWDEFYELALKLNKGDRKGVFMSPTFNPLGEYQLITAQAKDPTYAADGLSNWNHPAVRKGLEMQKQLQDKGALTSWSEAVANKLTLQNELLTGKAAMITGGNWVIRYVKDTKTFPHDFKVAIAPMPQFQKGANVNTNGYGDFMSINKSSPNQEAAFKFIKWYMLEGNVGMAVGGRIPTSKKTDTEKVVSLILGDSSNLFDVESVKSYLKAEYVFPQYVKTTALPEVEKAFKEEAEKYILGAQSLDQTIEIAKSRSDKAIQAAKK